MKATARAALFPVEGSLALEGLQEPVTVHRDAWGVPYIEAGSLDDLWFAQGAVTAGERLFQLDLTLRAANGRLAEVFGERMLDRDRFAKTVGFHRAGARIAEGWDADSVRMHGRFREGVAAWTEAMPAAPLEYTLLDLEPALPKATGAWAAAFVLLSWGLSGNATYELLRAWITERMGSPTAAAIMPPTPDESPTPAPGALNGGLFDTMFRPGGQGSNAWALAPSRTSSGGALLANDPHLEATLPGLWLEMHLSAPGYRARGVALPWSPGIVLGTTGHHAWGATNVTGDVQDLFIEELSDDGRSVRRGEEWAPVMTHAETIEVRGTAAVGFTVRETSHGPLLDRFPVGDGEVEHVDLEDLTTPTTAVALAWTGLEHAIQPSLALKAASARSFDEFKESVQGVTCPGQNFVYADVEGTIGYVCTGVYPVRRAGDGTMPVPAGNGDHAWIGTIDPAELPWAENPARGFVVTANDRPHDEAYPHLIGRDFHMPHRAGRIATVLDESVDHGVASTSVLQADTLSSTALDVTPMLGRLQPVTDDQRLALGLLAAWDGDMRADSPAALVFQVWSGVVARRRLAEQLGEDLFERYHADREIWHCQVLRSMVHDEAGKAGDDLLGAFDEAIMEIRERLGQDISDWRWGAMHRLRLAHPLATIPGLAPLFTAVDAEVGGDESTIAQMSFDARHGYDVVVIPSWRAVYDLADLDRSVGVLPAGNSGNPASPHWNDQAPLWLAGKTHPLPFSPAAVEAAAVAEMRLAPGTISG